MKHNTNTTANTKRNTTTATTAAKVATKVAKDAGKMDTAATMDAAAVLAAAKDTAMDCHTCKEIAAKFAALVAMYGKGNAIAIQAAAKQLVKDTNAATAAAAMDVRAYLNDGAKVAAAVVAAYLNDERDGKPFFTLVYDSCGRNLYTLVGRYSSLVAEKDGNIVPLVKVSYKDTDNARKVAYKPRNLAAVGGYLAALKQAVNNAKRVALGAPLAKVQTKVDAAAVTWAVAEDVNGNS